MALKEDEATSFQSIDELQRAAAEGNSRAQNDLARRYHLGEGVPKDFAEALKWYRLSAEQGEPSAQNSIGVCYERGEGVSQDLSHPLSRERSL
jgi:TPR repeat protein